MLQYVKLAMEAGLWQRPYFYVMGAAGRVVLDALPLESVAAVGMRVVGVGEASTHSLSSISADMALLAVTAVSRQLFSFRTLSDPERLHAAAADGLGSINPTRPVVRGHTVLSFDPEGSMGAEVHIYSVGPQGVISELARVLHDGNVAIFDFAARDTLERPTLDDYLYLQKGLSTYKEEGWKHAWTVASIAAPVTVLACGLILWAVLVNRNRKMRPPYDFGPDLKTLPLGNRPFSVPLELPSASVRLGKLLGKGSFGEVMLGRYKGRAVAVKRIRMEATDGNEARQRVLREMLVLAQFRHEPHVLHMEGVMTRGPTLSIVSEYCSNGALNSYLLTQQAKGGTVPWGLKYCMARDLALGMAVVHSAGYLHMDLAARNVLVCADGRCKISDLYVWTV